VTPFARDRDGRLCAERVPLIELAESVGTPCYVYSAGAMRRALDQFMGALEAGLEQTPRVCFAMKANGNPAVLRLLASRGAGADVVSAGELRRARAAGIAPDRIVFSGAGKTGADLAEAVASGIHQINVESAGELARVAAEGARRGVRVPVALRVNPDVDAGTHDKIATGRAGDKFGVLADEVPEVMARAAGLAGIAVVGLAMHIGSHIHSMEAFRRAFTNLASLYTRLQNDGWALGRLDLGGGLGIPYTPDAPAPDFTAYAAAIADTVGHLGAALTVEPGRCLVANAGGLLTRVVDVKHGRAKPIVVVDAGMNDLIRPALYDAYHAIEAVDSAEAAEVTSDVVGPVCESADTFARDRPLPRVAPGDHFLIHSAGAYGASMASMYNGRPLPPEVMVDGDRWAVVQARIAPATVAAHQAVPPWLEAGA